MSKDLNWMIIRKSSCFLKSRRNVNKKFSTEKFNLMGVNSPRYNGMINDKAVDVQIAKDGKGLVVTTKNKKQQKQSVAVINKGQRATLANLKRIVKNYGGHVMPAQRRASQLLRSLKPRSTKSQVAKAEE